MKLLIDSANIEDIKYINKHYPIDGVTTNPSILLKSGKQPYDALDEITEYLNSIGKYDLHVQVISTDAKGMIDEANRIVKRYGKDTYIKIPCVEEGLYALNILSAEGFNTTATAIYNAHQAYLAGKSGATYVAPYVNRMTKLYGDGVDTVYKIFAIFKNNDMPTKILGASFKTADQITDLAELGIDAATVPSDLLKNLLQDEDVLGAVKQFNDDFHKLCGNDTATM